MNKILRKIGNIYIALMLVLYPLILTNKYFNVTDTKLIFFHVSTLVFVLVSGGLMYLGWLKGMEIEPGFGLPRWYIGALLGVFISSFFTFLLSENKMLAINGQVEYGLGFSYIIIAILGALVLSIVGYDTSIFVLSIITGSVICSIFGMIQFIGVDIFGLLESIVVEDKNVFLSTLGNTSFFGFFMVLAFPIAIYAYFEMGQSYGYLALVCAVATSIGVVISNTDATIIAYVIEMLLTLNIVCKNGDIKAYNALKRLFTYIGLAMIALFALYNFAGLQRELGGVQLLFINPFIWLAFIFVVNSLGFILNKNDGIVEKVFRSIGLLSKIILGLILISPIIAVIYTKVTYIDLNSPISRMLYLDVNWGNQRGFIWSGSLDLFGQGTIVDKLFGRGIGTFSDLFQETYEVELREIYHKFYDDAHNMFLQWLIEYGILGLASILCLLIGTILFLTRTGDSFDKYKAVAIIGTMLVASSLIMQNITPAILLPFIAVNLVKSK